jgi:heat shock protein HslJ
VTATAEVGLEGTQWILLSLGRPGEEAPVIEATEVTLSFEAGNQAGGSAGCNTFGGDYEVTDNSLAFSQVVSTLRACAEEPLNEQEQRYLAALQSAGGFAVSEAQLTIWYDDGQGVLNFVRG